MGISIPIGPGGSVVAGFDWPSGTFKVGEGRGTLILDQLVGRLTVNRSVFYRAWIVLPCRTYRYLGSDGGSVPYGAMLGGVVMAAVVGGLWALGARVLGDGGADDFWVGAGVGVGLGMVWLVYTVVVVGVLHLTGRDWSQVIKRQRESS